MNAPEKIPPHYARSHDPVEQILDLLETPYKALPSVAIEAAKVFFLDTVGVACAGRMAPMLENIAGTAATWGMDAAHSVSLWNLGRKAPLPVAAMVNGYQLHALEYDCVYEPGVILPTPPLFAALMGKVEALAAQGRSVNGPEVLRAMVLGLEVSCTLAAATRSEMFFFRPTTTGVFSALAALQCLDPLPREQLRYAFGIAYSQVCGTMQAHEEGSMMLAMQMGFAARNAVLAHDMARAGVTAPIEIFGGRFGFYRNFEEGGALQETLASMGMPWKVTQLSHKPFPSGRVTHGVIHTMRLLARELDLTPHNALERIESAHVDLPPLGMRLVGRPMVHQPAPNYARLCVPYVAAAEVMFGGVDPTSFTPERLNNEQVEILARRITTAAKAHPNPNAFYPQTLTLRLNTGEVIVREIPYAWGHPQMPLTAQEREDKFRLCWKLSRASDPHLEATIAWLQSLEDANDMQPLLNLLAH